MNQEASVRCLQAKAVPYHLQDEGSSREGFREFKDENNAHPGGGPLDPDISSSSETFGPPNETYHRPIHQQDFHMWSNFNPDYQKAPQSHWNPVESFYSMTHEYPFPVENRIQYFPFRMLSQVYPREFQYQEFQYFVVIDFEATCDKEKNPQPQEIIEFPSVLVNSVTGQLEASFQTYVRPAFHQHLTDFCKELTGIQQIQVDRGVPLGEALLMHDKWLEDKGIKHTNFAVVTWSNWDCRVMLESECRFKRICKPSYFNRWINLKVPFCEVFGGVRCNLKEAVQLAGLVWEGRAHCGLDDARNTARLLTHLMHRGFRFSITNSLLWQQPSPPDHHHRALGSPSAHPYHPHYNKPRQLPSPMHPFIQFHHNHLAAHHIESGSGRESRGYCFCGVKSIRRMVRKPGPKHGSFFFGCGNWSFTRGALCPYFEWASS